MDYLKAVEIDESLETGVDLVDCIYVVNLDKRRNKWEATKEEMENNGLSGNRVSAVNGWQLTDDDMKRLSGHYPVRLAKGQVGCILSHLSIYYDALDRGFNLIWVLEDDIEVLEDVQQIPNLLEYLSAKDPYWDVFYTDQDFRDSKNGYIRSVSTSFRPDHMYHDPRYYLSRTAIGNNIQRIGQRFGTRSYLISKSGMEKLLDFYSSYPIWNCIDIDMHYIPGIREYCSTKDIVSNRRIRLYADTGEKSTLNLKNYPM